MSAGKKKLKRQPTAIQPPLSGRQGVSPSRVWLPQGNWCYLGEFLLQRFPRLNKKHLLARLQKGDIVNSNGQPVHYYTPYQAGQWLWYYRKVAGEVAVPFEIKVLYADNYLIAIDKPHFLPSIPSGRYLMHTAITRVRQYFNNCDITPLHRLDKDTAGVMLFCVQPGFRGVYQSLFQNQAVQKTYEAVAPIPSQVNFPLHLTNRIEAVQGEFFMQCTQGAPNSDTFIQLLNVLPAALPTKMQQTQLKKRPLGHYLLQPLTGRKHQLRVHMLSINAPIVHDRLYPVGQPERAATDFSQPLQLLARSISFIDPITREYKEFKSERVLDWVAAANHHCGNVG